MAPLRQHHPSRPRTLHRRDLNEAVERLSHLSQHLSQLWQLTYASLDDATLDAPAADPMTLRELAHHAAESIDYTTMLGTL